MERDEAIITNHLRDFTAERRSKLGAAAEYLGSDIGQREVAGKLGGSAPPTGGSSGGTEAERAEFLADLQQAPQDVLM